MWPITPSVEKTCAGQLQPQTREFVICGVEEKIKSMKATIFGEKKQSAACFRLIYHACGRSRQKII